MAKKGSIHGNQETMNGGIEAYTIKGRGVVSRVDPAAEVEDGIHEGFSIVEISGTEYVRSHPGRFVGNPINSK